MVSEREKARQRGAESPVQESYADTQVNQYIHVSLSL